MSTCEKKVNWKDQVKDNTDVTRELRRGQDQQKGQGLSAGIRSEIEGSLELVVRVTVSRKVSR